ncbi:hypothetical protein OKW44_007154 [Paraburkholderia sp. WSM4174]
MSSAAAMASSGIRFERDCDVPRGLEIAIRLRLRERRAQHARLDTLHDLLQQCRRDDHRGPRTQCFKRREQAIGRPQRPQLRPGFVAHQGPQLRGVGVRVGFEKRQDRCWVGLEYERVGPVIRFGDPWRRSTARRGKQMHRAEQADLSAGELEIHAASMKTGDDDGAILSPGLGEARRRALPFPCAWRTRR